MIRSVCFLAFWLLCGCDSAAKETLDAPSGGGIENLPHLSQNGRRFPYLRYENTSPNSGDGRVFFLFPMMDRKNGLLALEAGPRSKMEELFAEDLLGISGLVSNANGIIRIDTLPVSLPVGVRAGQEWQVRYSKREFLCRSRVLSSKGSGKLGVSCRSGQYSLNFIFDRDRGVEEYQDFCDVLICTFRLVDEEGLLSREMLVYMGLPAI
jgi:hypothetical protein